MHLIVDSLHTHYNMAGDEARLKEVLYRFRYTDLEEAQYIWEWIYEQKMALDAHFGKSCEYVELGDTIPEMITAVQLYDKNNFRGEWNFEVEGSDWIFPHLSKPESLNMEGIEIIWHQIVYLYDIRFAEDEEGEGMIIVTLSTTERIWIRK